MSNLLKCKHCGHNGELRTWEIAEDDESKYTVEMYFITCENENCISQTNLKYIEDDAIEEWNNEYGRQGMTLQEVIENRYDRATNLSKGISKDSNWTSYYNGWKDAYKDLYEILTQHGFDLNQLVIKEPKEDIN